MHVLNNIIEQYTLKQLVLRLYLVSDYLCDE